MAHTEKNAIDFSNGNLLINPDFFGKDIKIDRSRIFPMLVMATMSSGKSTLINALLGRDILPSRNVACTAKVYSILDDDTIKEPMLYLTDNNGTVTVIKDQLPEELSKVNESDNVQNILVVGQIKGVTNTERSLLVIDTPGPNNSRDTSHEQITSNVLQQVQGGLILYVLNATQMEINDDRNFLLQIKNCISKKPKIKIVFAINKVDELDFERESVEALILQATNYLNSLGFQNPEIIPVSALAAQLFKKALNGDPFTRRQLRSFQHVYDLFEPRGINLTSYAITSDTPDLYRKITVGGKEFTVSKLMRAIDNTGISYLEKYIQTAQILSSNIDALQVSVEQYDKIEKPVKSEDARKVNEDSTYHILTYSGLVNRIRNCYSTVDISCIKNHFAVQFNIEGDISGIFYLEIKKGNLRVEPYSYYDRDALIKTSAQTLLDMATGNLCPDIAITLQKVQIIGDRCNVEQAIKILWLLYSKKK